MRRPPNGKAPKDSERLSGYITPKEKKKWKEMVALASKIDGIRNPDNGTFLSRIIRNGLGLDNQSMSRYVKTHPPQDQDPARN